MYFCGQLKASTNVVEAGIFKFNPGTIYYWRADARVPKRDSLNARIVPTITSTIHNFSKHRLVYV